MRKWTILLFVAVLTIILGACGSKGETVTLKLDQGSTYSEIIYTYNEEDDEVMKQTTKSVVSYADLGISSKEEAEESFGEIVDEFQGIDGLEHTIKFDDDSFTEELSIDYENADIEQVSELPGSSFEGNFEEGISLKESVKAAESQGFEVVE